MKESVALEKICIQLMSACVSNGRMTDPEDIAATIRCRGSACMMWEIEMAQERKDISVNEDLRTTAQAKRHVPDGWYYGGFLHAGRAGSDGKSIVKLTRMGETDKGGCGLKTKELYCEGRNQ